MTWMKVAHLPFLRRGPIQRNVPGDDHALAQLSRSFPLRADRLCHMIDFVVRGADHEHIAFMRFGFGIRGSDNAGAVGPRDFTHGAHSLELRETLTWIIAQFLDGFSISADFLSLDFRQLD